MRKRRLIRSSGRVVGERSVACDGQRNPRTRTHFRPRQCLPGAVHWPHWLTTRRGQRGYGPRELEWPTARRRTPRRHCSRRGSGVTHPPGADCGLGERGGPVQLAACCCSVSPLAVPNLTGQRLAGRWRSRTWPSAAFSAPRLGTTWRSIWPTRSSSGFKAAAGARHRDNNQVGIRGWSAAAACAWSGPPQVTPPGLSRLRMAQKRQHRHPCVPPPAEAWSRPGTASRFHAEAGIELPGLCVEQVVFASVTHPLAFFSSRSLCLTRRAGRLVRTVMRARRRQTRASSGVQRDLRAEGRGSVRRDGPGHGAAGAHASLMSLPPLHPLRHADPSARGPKGPLPVQPALPALLRQSRRRTHCVARRRMAPAHEGGGCLVSARWDGRQRSQSCIVRRLRCSGRSDQIARVR